MRAALRQRRDEVAGAVFSTWVVGGLFLDGWAHHADKAESFWTPWHAVLYAGFFAGSVYAGINALLARRAGEPALTDKLVGLGFVAFLLGGMGDSVWHTIFGVEEDLEALLSPTHLLLMIGGLLLTTSPVRSAWQRLGEAPRLGELVPALVGMTTFLAAIGFFLHFASPFVMDHGATAVSAPSDTEVAVTVMGMLATTVLLLGATFVLRARWRLPAGSLLLVYGGFALFMTGLHAFDQVALVLPAALAGALADILLASGVSPRLLGAAVPAVLWSAWFATFNAIATLNWAPELWTGTIVFAALTGLGLSFLAQPPAQPALLRPDTAPATRRNTTLPEPTPSGARGVLGH